MSAPCSSGLENTGVPKTLSTTTLAPTAWARSETARSMTLLAAHHVAHAAPAERTRVVSAAKVRVGDAARFVGQQAVQLHGGIGVTDELAVSHYFKRLTLFEAAFGDADFHLEAVGRRLFD